MRDFGLFDSLELPLTWKSAYSNQQGVYNSVEPERAYLPSKTARVAFGHAMTSTPVHVALAYASLLNEGVLMKARLIRETRTPDNKVQETFPPKPVRQVVSKEVAAQMREMMRAVVVSGTGKKAAVPGYQVGGKTGTAQQIIHGKQIYVSSFVGYLPASKPEVVILVSVNDPSAGRHFGGDIAAPVFREIAQRLMQHWGVPEDAPTTVSAPTNLRPTPLHASRVRAKAR
jgi:cell division protein FtsI/penicillin-binding protein 2